MQVSKSLSLVWWVAIALILPETKVEGAFSSPSPECNFDTWGTTATASSTAIQGDVSPVTVGHQQIELVDPDRDDRPVTTDVWYPAVADGEALTRYNPLLPPVGDYFKALAAPAAAEGAFPLLVFSHGSRGIASQSATLMEHLASWGFVVAAPNHAGNSYNDDPGHPISFTTRDRPMDVSFVIDSLTEAPHKENFSISSSHVGVMGNSYGGLTAALVASGFEDYPRDARVLAAMPISPSINFSPEDASICSNIEVPMLLLGGENDTTTPVANNELIFEESIKSFPRWNTVIRNAGHTSFSDTCILYDIVLDNFAGGNPDVAYSLMGSGNLEVGRSRIESAFCGNTLSDTLPVVEFSAVAFFRSVLLDDSVARECLDDLYSAQEPPLSNAGYGIDDKDDRMSIEEFGNQTGLIEDERSEEDKKEEERLQISGGCYDPEIHACGCETNRCNQDLCEGIGHVWTTQCQVSCKPELCEGSAPAATTEEEMEESDHEEWKKHSCSHVRGISAIVNSVSTILMGYLLFFR